MHRLAYCVSQEKKVGGSKVKDTKVGEMIGWVSFWNEKGTLNNELSEMVRNNVRNGFERSSRCGIWPDGRGLGVVDFHERSKHVML